MNKAEKQSKLVLEISKVKTLMVLKILWEETDDLAGDERLEDSVRRKHSLSRAELVKKLSSARRGFNFNIKGVANDLGHIEDYFDRVDNSGIKLKYYKSPAGHNETRYYIANRPFSVTDITILADAVNRMRFINNKRGEELKSKLKDLAGKKIWKSVDSFDSMQEEFYSSSLETEENIEKLQRAIKNNKIVTFRYFEWAKTSGGIVKKDKEKVPLSVSPWKLIYTNGSYYLVAYNVRYKDKNPIRHYRVDKMIDIKITKYKREGKDEYLAVKTEDYYKKMFNMYYGKDETVHMLIEPYLVNVIVDRFGSGVQLYERKDGKIEVVQNINVSPQFYAWIAGLNDGIEIIEPEYVRQDLLKLAQKMAEKYSKKT